MSKPVLGPEELTSHVGEGVHTGLRKGTDAPSSAAIWQVIYDSEDSAWGDAISYFIHGLKDMYPDGFVYDPDKPADKPQYLLDNDGVLWRWHPRRTAFTAFIRDGVYLPMSGVKDIAGASSLDELRERRGPLRSVEISEDEV